MGDVSLKGIEGARANRVTRIRPKSDWRRPDNHQCLTSDCSNPVYHDGSIYFSLCLSCLKAKQLGPYFPRKPEVKDDDWPDRGCCSASLVAESLFRKESKG
jgi:hypothetical protein